jgi:MFS family permease
MTTTQATATHALSGDTESPRLGLIENWQQFALLVVVNGFVGMMIGAERSVLPLVAEKDFAVRSATTMFTFLIAFGLTKAVANLLAGAFAERAGRRRILIAGWLFAVPVPLLFWWAPSWPWIVFANVLLGINQGLTWSVTVIMKIDLVGPQRRGLAMGLNEFAGYVAVAAAAFMAGALTAHLGGRNAIVVIGAVAVVFGLGLTLLFVRDTGRHVDVEQARHDNTPGPEVSRAARFWAMTWKRRPLLAANQAGFMNNLNDGVAWGVFPLFFATAGLSLGEISFLIALYPATWGIAQIFTGALSDRIGRRPMIVYGMLAQGAALGAFALSKSVGVWTAAAVLLGVGTASVYPTLIAHVSDSVVPQDRATGVGVYRLWRDLGYVAGGLIAGVVVDLLGFEAAIGAVAVLTAASGLLSRHLLPQAVRGARMRWVSKN